MSEAGPVLYDTAELRLRIAGSFSAGELRSLAESLGVGGINWDRGIQEAAREVVRQSERYAGLPALVARLREARPLVEWPDPQPVAPPAAPLPIPQSAPPPAAAGQDAPRPPTPGAFPVLPTLSSSPGTFSIGGQPSAPAVSPPAAPLPPPARPPPPSTPAPAPVHADPYAPLPGPAAIHIPVPATAPGSFSPPAPPRAGWPGVVPDPTPAAGGRGIDPRIFIAVAGLMVVAAVIAYLAGRASSASAEADASASLSASAAAAGRGDRPESPAAHAADVLTRGYASLARVCELPPSAGNGTAVFRRAFERCGPNSASHHMSASPAVTITTDTPPDPTSGPTATGAAPTANPDTPRGAAPPAGPRTKRPGRDTLDPTPSAKGCVGACDAANASCRSHCGPEPMESGAYDGYQRCLGICLKDASRCKLSCR